jgi:AraC-like DNA-binding protein
MKPMTDLYTKIKESKQYPKLKVNELLFVEYTCIQKGVKTAIWSDNNYFAFISAGKKEWRSIYHSYEVDLGDILFVKKGANITQALYDDFCAIFIFIPDDFIREFLKKNGHLINSSPKDAADQDSVLRVAPDELLENYYRSVRAFLSLAEKPGAQILQLKFEELLLSLFANKRHQRLTDYFISLCRDQHHQLSIIMEANFAYNLKLENFAQLCNMSLSAFKTAFKQYYHTTPAVWLKEKKLAWALQYILTSDMPISQISFECGFEDTSHFIRVFKKKHSITPFQYRQNHVKEHQLVEA